MSSTYIEYPIETDPDTLAAAAIAYLQSVFPNWVPPAGSLSTIMLEALARIEAETATTASDVPASIFRYFGKNLVNVPPIDAAPATVLSNWVVRDTNGYTIKAGTNVGIKDATGALIPFTVLQDTAVSVGSTFANGVTLIAATPGVDSSGLGGNGVAAQLIDVYDWVISVTLTGASSGGVDAEDDPTYLSRLAFTLQQMTPRPILPKDFAALAKNIAGVDRAVAIDLHNPFHNYLSLDAASLENSIGGWVANSNATVAQDATVGSDGTHSLKVTATAGAAAASARQPTGLGGTPVLGNNVYTFLASARPTAAGRSAFLIVYWYDAAGVLLRTDTQAAQAAANGAWTALAYTPAAAPPTAAFVTLAVSTDATVAAGEAMNFDKMSIRRGLTTDWVPGGTVETTMPKAVAVAALDAAGVPIATPVKSALDTYLQSMREANFVVNVIDPTVTLIDVTTAIHVLHNYDGPTVQANVVAAIQAYLNPANWGLPPTGDQRLWILETAVRLLKLAQQIENVQGVHYIDANSLTMAIHGQALAAADITLPGVAPIPNPNVITVTYTVE